ncbi:MAG: rRNA maturation RNase YbeY [Candidatus Brocadiaceae bacterium]|nr:rRNA maturation RNase YbeY [Candidatus Brocadiaceae bacterium]
MSCDNPIPVKLEIINLQKLYPINKKRIRKLVRNVLKNEKRDAELNIVFIDNKKIRKINRNFLGHNYATDVISFSYGEIPHENAICGEIIVSVEMALHRVQEDANLVEDEIALYVVHGLLHLLGYDDKQKGEAKKMHQREKELLLQQGYRIFLPLS